METRRAWGSSRVSCSSEVSSVGAGSASDLVVVDSKGVIYRGRPGLTEEKAELAADTEKRTLGEAVKGAATLLDRVSRFRPCSGHGSGEGEYQQQGRVPGELSGRSAGV